MSALRDDVIGIDQGLKLYQQERTILAVTELICEIMARDNISRSELAKRLGKPVRYVNQILDGNSNLTLRTISDVLTKLGYQLNPKACII